MSDINFYPILFRVSQYETLRNVISHCHYIYELRCSLKIYTWRFILSLNIFIKMLFLDLIKEVGIKALTPKSLSKLSHVAKQTIII